VIFRFGKQESDIENIDRQRAERMRHDMGMEGVLVSWEQVEDGWMARVSCRAWPDTMEAVGPSITSAIRAADAKLTKKLVGV
jgi:hypothetical protein